MPFELELERARIGWVLIRLVFRGTHYAVRVVDLADGYLIDQIRFPTRREAGSEFAAQCVSYNGVVNCKTA